jgi:Ca2+-binding RTX toxin-like protein
VNASDLPATIMGGGGDDRMFGSASASDRFHGGSGADFVLYREREEPVSLSLNGLADDGAAGEGDFLADDIELLEGGRAGDVLHGGANADSLLGGPGADTIFGHGGDDLLWGDDHFDFVNTIYNPGDDVLDGGAGDDRLEGHEGNDSLTGGDDRDSLFGFGGNDTLSADEGLEGGILAIDTVWGGGGELQNRVTVRPESQPPGFRRGDSSNRR